MNTEEFYKLSRQERAVAVAKDVIQQIKISKYLPINGTYLRFLNGTLTGQIKDTFNTVQCQVCALGATIMSCTHLGNRLEYRDMDISNDYVTLSVRNDRGYKGVTNLLLEVFDAHTLLLIENAFEGYYGNTSEDFEYASSSSVIRYAHNMGETLSREECIKCHDFYNSYNKRNDEDDEFEDNDASEDSTNRLLGIMENIIRNEGNFIL